MINFPDYILKYAKQCMNKRQQFVQRYSDLYLTEEIKEYLCNNNLSSKCLCLIIRNNLDYNYEENVSCVFYTNKRLRFS